ncbi:MAG: ECF-type sigma factor [Gammaproteobacteria bacterium]|jgi:RNA polymerase sigma factor (TIGR02999 family)|nr:ECF-type sigma factor [Gammaproteobacteria bacterium]
MDQHTTADSNGDQAAMQAAIYQQLKAIAGKYLGREYGPVTISPATLAHEAWIKLRQHRGFSEPAFRNEFVALAGSAMRQILIDHARTRTAQKRIPRGIVEPLTEQHLQNQQQITCSQLLQLDQALQRLQQLDATMVKVVELRYFGGFSLAQTATILDTSERSVSRHWTAARAWLQRELS